MKTWPCKAKYVINLKPNPTLLDTRDLVLLSNLPRLWTLVCELDNRPFPLENSNSGCLTEQNFVFILKKTTLVQTILPCQNNAAVRDGLFSTYPS